MSWDEVLANMDAVIFTEGVIGAVVAIYTPVSGSPASITVIIEQEIVYDDDTGLPTAERQTVIDFRKSDWFATPVAGDAILANGVTYTVVGLGVIDGKFNQGFDNQLWRVRVRQ